MKTGFPRFGMRELTSLSAVLLLFVLTAASGLAANEDPVGPKLTPKLKDLIIEEMQLVLQASGEIHTAIVTGDHESVAEQATKIHDSFILQRLLTEQDKKDLMKAVPAAFVALDTRLHETAARLANAAEQKDAELETIFFGKMTEACVSCHSAYASDRFPSLSATAPTQH